MRIRIRPPASTVGVPSRHDDDIVAAEADCTSAAMRAGKLSSREINEAKLARRTGGTRDEAVVERMGDEALAQACEDDAGAGDEISSGADEVKNEKDIAGRGTALGSGRHARRAVDSS